METWQLQTLYWTLTILVLLYLIAFFYVLHNVLYFSSRLQKKSKTILIVFAEKKEILLSLYAIYTKAKMPITSEDEDLVTRVRQINLDSLKPDRYMAVKDDFNALQRKLIFLSEREKYIQQSEEFQEYSKSLKDIEKNYRRVIAAYNTDLTGYLYWRNRILYRPIFALLGFRKKERLV